MSRGVFLVNLVAIITLTIAVSGLIFQLERLSFNYTKTKNRGETYLCFHYFKEKLSKPYIRSIEFINSLLVTLQGAKKIPIPAISAIATKIHEILKWVQEAIKLLYLGLISTSSNCDRFQKIELLYHYRFDL